MNQIIVTTPIHRVTLGPGQLGNWFVDNVSQHTVRYFSPVILNTIIEGFAKHDQSIEIVRVFYILKGDIHTEDGSGGARTYQANVTVQNLDQAHAVTFDLLMLEIPQT